MLKACLNYSIILDPVTKLFSPVLFPARLQGKGAADGGNLTCPDRKRVLWWPYLPGFGSTHSMTSSPSFMLWLLKFTFNVFFDMDHWMK